MALGADCIDSINIWPEQGEPGQHLIEIILAERSIPSYLGSYHLLNYSMHEDFGLGRVSFHKGRVDEKPKALMELGLIGGIIGNDGVLVIRLQEIFRDAFGI